MSLQFGSDVRYDCVQCGRGCQMGWDIPVEPEVAERVQNHPLSLRVVNAFVERDGQQFIRADQQCRSCGFLEDDLLCGIHRELGFAAKPATCQTFPFVLTETPDGTYVGATFYCSAVRQNLGRPLSQHADDVAALLAAGAPTNRVAADGLQVFGRRYTSWAAYQKLEQRLLERSDQVGLQQALAQATLGLARRAAGWEQPDEPAPLAEGELDAVWDERSNADGALRQLIGMQLGDYFKFLLQRELWDGVDKGAFSLPAFNWSGGWNDLWALVDERVGRQFDEEIDRYRRHLIFRKALIIHPPLLGSLTQLHVLPDFLRVFSALNACRHGRQAETADYHAALEEAETYLVTHGRNRRIIHEMASEDLVNYLRQAGAAS